MCYCMYYCIDSYSFSIGDTRSFGDYIRGGVAIQVKTPKPVNFVSVYYYIIIIYYFDCFVLYFSFNFNFIFIYLLEINQRVIG